MFLMIVIALFAVACIAYGIWEHKNVYSKKQFCEAKVVGYQSTTERTLFMQAVAAVSGFVHPVVNVTLSDGSTQDVKLYTKVLPEIIKQFPEFAVGGRVDVTFFGDSPKEVYLVNHPMAETVVKFSVPLVIGIALASVDAIIVACLLLI